jgi:signal transduction histidine kinase
MNNTEALRINSKPDQYVHAWNEHGLNIFQLMLQDLRDPLISISATLKLLDRGYFGKVNEEVASILGDLLSKIIGLVGITEDYLGKTFLIDFDLNKAGEILDMAEEVIDPILNEFSSETGVHPTKVEYRLTSFGKQWVPIKGNRILLRMVFRNLLKNAIKYGDKGCRIVVGVEEHGEFFRFNVYNEGNPIPEELRSRLFTKFFNLETEGSANRELSGLGLGLFLAKEIIREHGGDIWYEANGHGSNFVFTLPRQVSQGVGEAGQRGESAGDGNSRKC